MSINTIVVIASYMCTCVYIHVFCTCMKNYVSLNKKDRPICYTKLPTVQHVFWPIPNLINCTGMIRRWACSCLDVCETFSVCIHIAG